MIRMIDPEVARRTAAHMETLEKALSTQMAAAVALLHTAGGDSRPAARVRASSGWWIEEASRLRARADKVDTDSVRPGLGGPTISGPPSPRDLVLTDLSKLAEKRVFLSMNLALLNRFFSWLPGEPLRSLRVGLTLAIARLDLTVADRQAWADPSRHLLLFDPSGDGRIAEAIGDQNTARHIVVLVPGVGNDLSSYERTFRSEALRLASRLSGTETAVVTWLGYNPPDNIVGALSREPARQGVDALGAFVARLGPAHTTVIAHSYGSLVAGLAAKEGALAPDELVFIG